MDKLLDHVRYLTPDFEIQTGRILIAGEQIAAVVPVDAPVPGHPELTLDLEGALVFPALVNAHDHLYGSFEPRFVPHTYRNWFEWEADYKCSDLYRRKQMLSIVDLYALGMYRNAMAGVGLVMDHFPHEVNHTFYHRPMVRLVDQYGLAHSVSSHRLDWGAGIVEEFTRARGTVPFVLHIEEGFDQEIEEELENLHRIGALGENTVVVHGVALNDFDVELLARAGAKLVWCPTSNLTMYGATAPIQRLIDAGVPVCLGTDSPVTGASNLLDELRTAAEWSQHHLSGRLTNRDLLRMVTETPARALGLAASHGAIEPGRRADLLVFADQHRDPLTSFFALRPRDFQMVLHGGVLVYGDERFRSACSIDFDSFSEVMVDGRPKLIWGKPLELLERIASKLGEERRFSFMPVSEP